MASQCGYFFRTAPSIVQKTLCHSSDFNPLKITTIFSPPYRSSGVWDAQICLLFCVVCEHKSTGAPHTSVTQAFGGGQSWARWSRARVGAPGFGCGGYFFPSAQPMSIPLASTPIPRITWIPVPTCEYAENLRFCALSSALSVVSLFPWPYSPHIFVSVQVAFTHMKSSSTSCKKKKKMQIKAKQSRALFRWAKTRKADNKADNAACRKGWDAVVLDQE